jgi:hypothetical protein
MDITADAEASLPQIVEEARRLMTNERRRTIEQRSLNHAGANRSARIADLRLEREGKRAPGDAVGTATFHCFQ